MVRSLTMTAAAVLALCAPAAAQSCGGNGVTVQILGSGGPTPWASGRRRAICCGSAARPKCWWIPAAGPICASASRRPSLADLALVAISHLHPDHVSDLPAILWTSGQRRSAPLPIVGPSGNDVAPAFPTFLSRLFDEKTGAFQVLGAALGGTGNSVRLDVSAVDVATPEPIKVFDGQGLTVTAFGIPHANLPTLAYRVQAGGVSVVFSSDQNGTKPSFITFAKGANALIMHMAIAPGTTSPLHAAPAVVGRIAADAGVGRLILSHIGQFPLDPAIADVKKAYTGPLTVGADLQCTPVQ